MTKITEALICLTVAVCVATAQGAAAPTPERPNIVFILADDIGYGDLSCYGAKLVSTPNLDCLARSGCRFTDAHSAASVCSPSRRALLTGTYSWRQEPGSRILNGDAPLSIEPGSFTLPAMLKKAGYATAVVGKWHLGLGGDGGPDWNGEIKPGPLELGFDYAFFFPATGDRVPCVFIENRRVVGLDPADPIQVNYKKKIGNEPTGRENPELLKLKLTRNHDNTIVNGISRIGWMTGGKSARWKDELIADTFTSKAVSFIGRSKERPFFLYFATHNIHVPRVPNPRHLGKSACGTRGDAIVELDAAVGEILATLEKNDLTRKTLVIFTSDNGGRMDDGYEDIGDRSHPCNGVLRGHKQSVWEGGHRVPFIVSWPEHVRAGTQSDELITHIDMAASLASLTGQTLPAGAAPDSYNVLPALLGTPHHKPLRAEFVAQNGGTKGLYGVRLGDWKLVQGGGVNSGSTVLIDRDKQTTPGSLQLFNLKEDLSETRDLAARQPDKVKELTDVLERLQHSTGSAQTTASAPQASVSGEETSIPGVRVLRDLAYIENGHERNRLDLYLPEKSDGPLPVIVWVHGGGWTNGDKSRTPASRFAALGYAVAAINYRFSQDAIFPAQIQDCKAAIRWLRANAAKYGLDPAHFGAWGGSSGGHLVALLGTTSGVKEFEGTGGNLDQSSSVQAVVDWNGPTDFLTAGKKDTRTNLIGGDPEENRDKAIKASPMTYVSKNAAPFLIMHGDRDKTVPIGQSETFARALKESGADAEFVVIAGAAHGGPLFTNADTMKKIEDFFGKHLR